MPAKSPSKPRAERNQGGLYEKKSYWIDKQTKVRHDYKYWQACQDLDAKDLLPGVERKRITGSGRTKSEARRRLAENLARYHRGDPTPRTKKRAREKITISKLWADWQELNRKGRVTDIMKAKYDGYGKHILPALGHIKLDELEEDDLHLFFGTTLLKKERKDGRPLLQSAARRNIYMALSGCFTYGVTKGYFEINPLEPVPVPKRQPPRDDIDLAIESAFELLSRLRETNNPDYCRFLCAFLGLRRAERLALSWSNIKNLESDSPEMEIWQQLARFASQETGGWHIKDATKGGKPRTIVVPEPWISALREHKKQQEIQKRSPEWKPEEQFKDLVFLQPSGSIYTLNRDNLDWHKLLDAYSLPHFRGHLARHITATILAEQKPTIPIGTIMNIIGHSSQSLALYYAKTTSEQQKSHMETFGNFFEKKIRSPRDR